MNVTVNGERREVADGATLEHLIVEVVGAGRAERGVAVAVDGTVVPRSRWAGTRLAAGATVDVVTAVQGG